MLSHVDCNTLDRYAATAAAFMRQAGEAGYTGGFETVIWDHDQAYQQVKRSSRFPCLVPVLSLGEWFGEEWVEAGRVVYLEMHRLLFGEAGSVPAYCRVARTIAVTCCKVLGMPCGHFLDSNVAPYRLEDLQVVHVLRELVKDVLRVHFKDVKFAHGRVVVYLGVETVWWALPFGLGCTRTGGTSTGGSSAVFSSQVPCMAQRPSKWRAGLGGRVQPYLVGVGGRMWRPSSVVLITEGLCRGSIGNWSRPFGGGLTSWTALTTT